MFCKINHIKILFLFAANFISPFVYGQSDGLFEKHLFISDKTDTLPYRLLRPPVSDTIKKVPLVIFLHGAGERGNDNAMQLVNGAKNFATDSIMEKYPCFVLVPQCAKIFQWVETDWRLPSHTMPDKPSVFLSRTMLLADSLIKNLNIDTNRIYITGLSMGGFGTWDAICRWPDKFAAAVPVCGGGDTAKAAAIKDIAIWAFHGEMDKGVMVSRTRNMINSIKKAGGSPKYTEYASAGHNVWKQTYSNAEVIEWLFAQNKKDRKK